MLSSFKSYFGSGDCAFELFSSIDFITVFNKKNFNIIDKFSYKYVSIMAINNTLLILQSYQLVFIQVQK